MKTLIALLLLLTHNLYSQKKEYPPEIKVELKKYNVVYDENASYTYTLNTDNIDIIKPETTIMKVLIFENDKQAYLSSVYTTEEVKLVNHDFKKTNFQYKTRDEISLKVNINKDKVTLTKQKNKQTIILKILGEYDDISLKNIKTGEIFKSDNPQIESRKSYRLPPFYMPSNNSSKNSSK